MENIASPKCNLNNNLIPEYFNGDTIYLQIIYSMCNDKRILMMKIDDSLRKYRIEFFFLKKWVSFTKRVKIGLRNKYAWNVEHIALL